VKEPHASFTRRCGVLTGKVKEASRLFGTRSLSGWPLLSERLGCGRHVLRFRAARSGGWEMPSRQTRLPCSDPLRARNTRQTRHKSCHSAQMTMSVCPIFRLLACQTDHCRAQKGRLRALLLVLRSASHTTVRPYAPSKPPYASPCSSVESC
jgi:hypothetical protein